MNSLLLAVILTGFGKADITPPVGAFLPGYYQQRIASGADTPLELQCVAFSDGDNVGLVFSVDNLHLTKKTIAAAQGRLKAQYGVPPENTYIASTHIHTGAATDTSYYINIQSESAQQICDRYGETIEQRLVDAAAAAILDLKPSTFAIARTTCPGLSFIRRYRMKDGTVMTNPSRQHPELVDHELGAPDNEVQVVRIRREGGPDIALVNFQTHPDTVGGDRYHWDWPGEFRQYFERALADGTKCFFLNGSQGDTNHLKVLGEIEPWRKAATRPKYPQIMGARLAGAALAAWPTCVPIEVRGKIRGKITPTKVASNRPGPKALKAIELSDQGLSNEEIRKRNIGLGAMEIMAICDKNSNARKLRTGAEFFEMPVSSIAIGDALAFAGFPGEPFSEIGRKVKDASPFQITFVGCLVNASFGYLPSSTAAKEGGYEVVASRFGATCGDTLITTQLENLRALARAAGDVPDKAPEPARR